MSNSAQEALQTALCIVGLFAMIAGMIIAWGWAGMLMAVGGLFFIIFLAMLT